MSKRDAIRSATVGAKRQFKNKTLNFNGVDVELRQPSIGDRMELFKRCQNEDGEFNQLDFLVWSVIYNTYVPDTNERVFEDTDYDTMVQQPPGGFVDQFSEEILELMNVRESEEKK